MAIQDVTVHVVAPATRLGTVEGIYIAPAAAAPTQGLREVQAHVERGLEGDRYAHGAGTFSSSPGTGRQVTLIQAEWIDAFAQETGIPLEYGAARRNLVTRGVDLMSLVGKRFRVGEVLLEGMRDCPPCGHLERLTFPGVARGLVDHGGLRAELRESGTLRQGDPISLAD